MTRVVIDAAAAAEILTGSLKGRALARLLPQDAEGWVPEHFYAEGLSVVRRQTVIQGVLSEVKATDIVRRLAEWHLHRASLDSLVIPAWAYRHNMTAGDALYVVLAQRLSAAFLTTDDKLVDTPTFPASIRVLRLPDVQ